MEQTSEPSVDPSPPPAKSPMPRQVFIVAVGYLVFLLVLFLLYELSDGFRDALPTSLGSLPVGVPFFGALGGLLASLNGIFWHNDDWDPSYNDWYYLKPVVGSITGSVGALLYLVSVKLGTSAKTINAPAFIAVAFLAGYAEQAFRLLIKRTTDVLLGPGKT